MRSTYLLLYLLVFASCKKAAVDTQGVSALPPATQIGANTAGALVNGSVFIAQKSFGETGSALDYGNASQGPYKGFHFSASDSKNSPSRTIAFYSNVAVKEGQTYQVQSSGTPMQGIYQSDLYIISSPGQLTITKLDTIKRIMSGTFSFDATNSSTGQKIEIRDGRFDVKL